MNEHPKRMRRADRFLAADPLPWAIWLASRRILSKVKSAYLGWLFHAPGSYFGPGSFVSGSRYMRFGANVYAQGNLWLQAVPFDKDRRFNPLIDIGDQVSFSERVHISCIQEIRIGKRVLIGSGTYIADHQHGVYSGPEQSHPDTPPALRLLGGAGPVIIGDDVWIGDNVVIVGRVTIGRGSIIGANSVVRRDIPDYTIAGGVPARAIKRFNGTTLQWEKI